MNKLDKIKLNIKYGTILELIRGGNYKMSSLLLKGIGDISNSGLNTYNAIRVSKDFKFVLNGEKIKELEEDDEYYYLRIFITRINVSTNGYIKLSIPKQYLKIIE